MIPAAFEYHAPTTIGEATALLARLGEDAKVLSGGQSLIPLMKLRLASPAHVVDINGIPGLAYIREAEGLLRIGALTRESELEESELVRTRYPLLHDTSKVIADPVVRNLATVGGNLAHGDPANDHPATMLALGAEVVAVGPEGRAAHSHRVVLHGTVRDGLRPDEILVEIRVPVPARAERRCLSEARAEGGRLRHRGRGRAADARRRRRVRAGRHRAHQRRADPDQGHEGRGRPEGQERRTNRRSSAPRSSPPRRPNPPPTCVVRSSTRRISCGC